MTFRKYFPNLIRLSCLFCSQEHYHKIKTCITKFVSGRVNLNMAGNTQMQLESSTVRSQLQLFYGPALQISYCSSCGT